MNSRGEPKAEVESLRRELMAEFEAEQGEDWQSLNAPGTYGCHELLDRTYLVSNMVESYVLTHPACVQNPQWFALAQRASDALQDLYQRISAEHLDAEAPSAPG